MNQELSAKYPELVETIKAAQNLDQIDGNTFEPDIMEIYFDGKFALQWVNYEITKHVPCDLSYSPELIELYIDGRLAFALFGHELVFNRFKPGTPMPLGKQGG